MSFRLLAYIGMAVAVTGLVLAGVLFWRPQ